MKMKYLILLVAESY